MLELCILNDIRDRESYGYDMVRTLARTRGLIISEGVIYPILARLRRERLVKTYMRDSSGGPERTYYKLTKKGDAMASQMNSYWQAVSSVTDSIKKGRKRLRG